MLPYSYTDVCQDYNAYFQDGCAKGDQCPHTHLAMEYYAIHCRRLNESHPPSTAANDSFSNFMIFWNYGNYKKCLEILKPLIINYPLNARYHSSIALVYNRLKMAEQSYYHHRRAICIDPNNPKHHLNYAIFLHKTQKYKDQVPHIKYFLFLALELSKNQQVSSTQLRASIHACIASFLWESTQDIEESINHYQLSLNYVDDPANHYHLARLLHHKKCKKDALYHYECSIKAKGAGSSSDDISDEGHDEEEEMKSAPIERHFYYALLLKECGKYNESERQFLACLKISENGNIAPIIFEYGILLFKNLKKYMMGLSYLDSARRFIKDKEQKKSYDKMYKYCKLKWKSEQEGSNYNRPKSDNIDNVKKQKMEYTEGKSDDVSVQMVANNKGVSVTEEVCKCVDLSFLEFFLSMS